jgi:hypothetical protein
MYCGPVGDIRSPLSNEILQSHEYVEELLQAYVMDHSSLAASIDVKQQNIQNLEDMVR